MRAIKMQKVGEINVEVDGVALMGPNYELGSQQTEPCLHRTLISWRGEK
jgi:hypothetical protein